MRIHLLVEVDDDVAEPQCVTGLTARAYEQLVDAITATVGEVISVRGDSGRAEGGAVG